MTINEKLLAAVKKPGGFRWTDTNRRINIDGMLSAAGYRISNCLAKSANLLVSNGSTRVYDPGYHACNLSYTREGDCCAGKRLTPKD